MKRINKISFADILSQTIVSSLGVDMHYDMMTPWTNFHRIDKIILHIAQGQSKHILVYFEEHI